MGPFFSGKRSMAAQFSPFQLFGMTPQFDIDENHLEKAYQAAMLKVHPDRFADRSAVERRVAEQWSARINEAHNTLKNPVLRAGWLCETAGFPIRAETNTAMPMDFLLKQMQWRRINEAHNTLKNPVLRAGWLCETAGFPIRAETNTAMPMDFLLKQMQWREALEEAEGNPESIASIRQRTESEKAEILANIATLIDQDKNWTRAVDLTRQLMFVNRFLDEVERVQKK